MTAAKLCLLLGLASVALSTSRLHSGRAPASFLGNTWSRSLASTRRESPARRRLPVTCAVDGDKLVPKAVEDINKKVVHSIKGTEPPRGLRALPRRDLT